MKGYFFDAKEFLGEKANSPDLYAHASKGRVYTPFNLDLYQWRRLLLADFAGDSKYHTIELQDLNNEFGKGAVVILYHRDGNVEVYCSKNLNNFAIKSREKYYWGLNWNIIGEKDIDYLFDISDKGIDACLRMTDRYNSVIQLRIKENEPQKRFQNILAPLGIKTDNAAFFPFMYLHRFSPVTCKGTDIQIAINGEEREPLVIPVEIEGQQRYHSRYSDDPCLAYWNRSFRGSLKHVEMENCRCTANHTTHTFIEKAGHCELSHISCENDKHKVYFHFSPPVPDLVCLRESARIQGRFAAGIDGKSGILGGEYELERNANKIRITIDPTTGWQPPVPGPLWFKTYRWIGDMEIHKDGVFMESNWIRRELI